MIDMEWAQPGVAAVSLCNSTPTRVTVVRLTNTQIICHLGGQIAEPRELRFRRDNGRNAGRRGTWDHSSYLLPLTDRRVIEALIRSRVKRYQYDMDIKWRELKNPEAWLGVAQRSMLRAARDIEKIKAGEVP